MRTTYPDACVGVVDSKSIFVFLSHANRLKFIVNIRDFKAEKSPDRFALTGAVIDLLS